MGFKDLSEPDAHKKDKEVAGVVGLMNEAVVAAVNEAQREHK